MRFAALCFSALMVVAASCGGSSSSTPEGDEFRAAVARTEATGSYRFELLIDPDSGPGATETGEVDVAHGLASSIVTAADVSTPRYSDSGADYVLSESPDGKVWVRYDRPDGGVSRSIGSIAAALVGEVERGETQTVDGLEFVSYVGTLRDAEAQPDKIRTGPITFWVGPDGLVARLSYEVFQGNGDGSFSTVSVSLRYWDYGADFSITLPPAEEVLSQEQFDEIFSTAAESGALSVPVSGR